MSAFLSGLILAFIHTSRVLLIGILGQQLSFFIMDRCCRRSRSTVPVRLCMIVRSTVLLTWDSWLGLHGLLLPQERLLFVFFNFVAPIIVYLAFFRAYEETFPVKVLICTVISEFVVSVATLLALLPVNVLENRADFTTMQGDLHPLDVLLFVLIPALFFLLVFLTQRVLVWFQKWTPVHKKLWLCFHLVFWFGLQMNVLFEGLGDTHTLSFLTFLQYQAAAILILLAGILYFIYRYFRTPSAGLSPFQLFLKEYAGTVPHTNPADFLEISGSPLQPEYVKNRATIPQQGYSAYNPELPQQPESLQNTAFLKNSSKEDASEYQNYLKQVQESSFTASLYHWCQDWKVNAVLSVLQEKASRNGIKLACDFMGFSCGSIDPEDFASILCLVFRPLFLNNRQSSSDIVIRCAATHYFLILQINTPRFLTDVRGKELQSLLRKYQGVMTTASCGDNTKLTFILSRE